MNTNGTKIIAEDLVLNFGGVNALNNVSFELREGEILAIIGPNGAGKTCVLNCVNGFYHPDAGEITFEGQKLVKPDKQLSTKGLITVLTLSLLICGPLYVLFLIGILRSVFKSSAWTSGSPPTNKLTGFARASAYFIALLLGGIPGIFGTAIFTSGLIGVLGSFILGGIPCILYNGLSEVSIIFSIVQCIIGASIFILLLRHLESPIPPDQIAQLGISRTFQNIELYTGLSTLDNLMAARHNLIKYNFLTAGLYFGWAHRQEMEHRRVVEDIIDFLEMAPIRYKPVGSLPYGQRKRVELGRALALEPMVLLLDEPMAGMNVEEKEDMARFILDTFELKNIPIIIIEHDMGLVMDIADRIIVLDFGQKIAEGTPEEIKTNPEVIRAYLGTE